MQREYESVLVFDQKLTDADIDKLIEKIFQLITKDKGEIKAINKLGKKNFSYPISGQKQGDYVHVEFTAIPSVLSELDKSCRVTDGIIRYMTTQKIKTVKTKAS
ncbi:MAG: 30S ribosomal protein S6 [Candidatus Firestonebacteria bacterium]